MLPDNGAQPLRLRRKRKIAIELRRELDAGNAGASQPSYKFLSEGVRQNGWREEQRLNRSALFGGAGDVPDAFDQVKTGARTALWSLQGPQMLEPGSLVCWIID